MTQLALDFDHTATTEAGAVAMPEGEQVEMDCILCGRPTVFVFDQHRNQHGPYDLTGEMHPCGERMLGPRKEVSS